MFVFFTDNVSFTYTVLLLELQRNAAEHVNWSPGQHKNSQNNYLTVLSQKIKRTFASEFCKKTKNSIRTSLFDVKSI